MCSWRPFIYAGFAFFLSMALHLVDEKHVAFVLADSMGRGTRLDSPATPWVLLAAYTTPALAIAIVVWIFCTLWEMCHDVQRRLD